MLNLRLPGQKKTRHADKKQSRFENREMPAQSWLKMAAGLARRETWIQVTDSHDSTAFLNKIKMAIELCPKGK